MDKTIKIIAIVMFSAIVFVVATLLVIPIYKAQSVKEEEKYDITLHEDWKALEKFEDRYVKYKEY